MCRGLLTTDFLRRRIEVRLSAGDVSGLSFTLNSVFLVGDVFVGEAFFFRGGDVKCLPSVLSSDTLLDLRIVLRFESTYALTVESCGSFKMLCSVESILYRTLGRKVTPIFESFPIAGYLILSIAISCSAAWAVDFCSVLIATSALLPDLAV